MSARVLIAAGQQIVREGLAALMDREGFEVVAQASTGEEAAQRAAEHEPDVAVVDLSGIEVIGAILQASHTTKLILLTSRDYDEYVIAAIRAGAKGYVLKTQPAHELVQAIEQVSAGGMYMSPGISRVVIDAMVARSPQANGHLTSREWEVLRLIAEGHSTRQVATLLGVSVKTAEAHRTRLMQKLDIHATAGLVRYAVRHGLIEP
jgi:DNA-binding NarL/FixJ family response regulator